MTKLKSDCCNTKRVRLITYECDQEGSHFSIPKKDWYYRCLKCGERCHPKKIY